MSELVWTEDLPNQPGWYWYDHPDLDPFIVSVWLRGGKWAASSGGESRDVDSVPGRWAGPIPLPSEPQPPVPVQPSPAKLDASARPAYMDALDQCDRIIDACGDVPERAEGFTADVMEKVESVRETIEGMQHVTDRQQSALDNWEEAIERCRN